MGDVTGVDAIGGVDVYARVVRARLASDTMDVTGTAEDIPW